MSGRPRTPTNVLALRGSFKQHPARGRERSGEPKEARALGQPPAYLEAGPLECWNDLAKMAPAGVLTYADRLALEAVARLWDELKQTTEEIVTKTGEVVVIRKAVKATEVQALMRACAAFGMTPADRSRVKVAQPDDDQKSGFDAL